MVLVTLSVRTLQSPSNPKGLRDSLSSGRVLFGRPRSRCSLLPSVVFEVLRASQSVLVSFSQENVGSL